MPGQNTGCYNQIRFVMDDHDGSLRFRRLGIEGTASCGETLSRLEEYLTQTPLRAVEMRRVRELTERCRPECREELLRVIEEQKRFFSK